jgi:hypothetical protein
METSESIVEGMILERIINLRTRAVEEGLAGNPEGATEYRRLADDASHMIR